MVANMDPNETEPIETATPAGMGDAAGPRQQRLDRPVRNHPLARHRVSAAVPLLGDEARYHAMCTSAHPRRRASGAGLLMSTRSRGSAEPDGNQRRARMMPGVLIHERRIRRSGHRRHYPTGRSAPEQSSTASSDGPNQPLPDSSREQPPI